MREIKFKGLTYEGTWKYGNLLIFENRDSPYDLRIQPTDYHQYASPVKPDSVCQFTGLYDKKLNELYEYDIIELDGFSEEMDYMIMFIEGAFCIANKETEEFVADIHYVQHADGLRCLIIGNKKE